MIRYRRLYEGDNPDLGDYAYSSIPQVKKYDIVRCAGYEWYIINIEGDNITLLAKNNNFFYDEVFSYTGSNEYKTSYVRDCLKGFIPVLDRCDVHPIPTRLNDVNCTDEVWVLSLDEVKKLPVNIRKFSRGYWLRTPSYNSDSDVAYVYKDGDFTSSGMTIRMPHSIRPAMKVRVEDLD